MNKNRIRLTESQLHRVIKESVKKVLREGTKPGANPTGASSMLDDFAMYHCDPDYGSNDRRGSYDADMQTDERFDFQEIVDIVCERFGVSQNRARAMLKGAVDSWYKQF